MTAISFVTNGRKIVLDGQRTVVASQGDILYVPAGRCDVLDDGFNEIVIMFSAGEISHLLEHLSCHLSHRISPHAKCPDCSEGKCATYPAWKSVKDLFLAYFNAERSAVIDRLRKMELLAMLTSNPKCCIQRCMLDDCDPSTENFEAMMHKCIFENLNVEQLAALTKRSVTAFKVEFQRRFHEPPHTWFNRQRLAHARMLLLSRRSCTVREIGAECGFPNESHFIKLFRKEYGIPPAAYKKAGSPTTNH